MDDRDRGYCEHALLDGDKALEYYHQLGSAWTESDMGTDAILKRIESFCECLGKVSDPEQERHPDFPWRLIGGIRNRLAHEYHGTKLLIVQEVLDDHLQGAVKSVRSWLA